MTSEPADPVEDAENSSDDALEDWLVSEHLVILPEEFFAELLGLMEEHVMRVVGIDRDRMEELIEKLEETVGEEGMMEMSMEELVKWMRTLNEM
jgi:hypothetical protein